jgi:MoaA/NifB/PqqE/SkfB family radical SAM enzyme
MSDPSLAGLSFLWLEITPGCNLHCQHCYTESSPLLKDPKIVDWEKVLKDAYRIGCRQVQFIGGEPTYNTPLLQYISTARKLGYTFVEVYTNLTLISETLANQFRRYRVQLATSFYSSRKEVHEAVTGVEGSFDKTVGGIRCVLRKKIPLRVGVISMETSKNEVKDCVDFLVGMGVERDNIRIDHTRPVGRGENLVKLQSLEEKLCGHCWEGKLAVSWDGTCYPCVFSREVAVGKLNASNLDEVLRSERLEQFRRRIFNYSSRFAVRTAGQDLLGSLLALFSDTRATGVAPPSTRN